MYSGAWLGGWALGLAARVEESKGIQNSLKNDHFKLKHRVLRSTNFKLLSQIKENSVNYCDCFSSQLLLDGGKCSCSRQPPKTWICHCMYNIILEEAYTTKKRGEESIYLAFIFFLLF
jgi:hypothetical protein